jgi:hypothetical protein
MMAKNGWESKKEGRIGESKTSLAHTGGASKRNHVVSTNKKGAGRNARALQI